MPSTDTATTPAARRALRPLTAAAAVVLLLAGCAAPGARDTASPAPGERIATSIEALIEQELSRDDLSDFERDVLERALETGELDADDYEEAFSRYSACVEDAGFDETATKLPNGLYQVKVELPAGVDAQQFGDNYGAAVDDCSAGTTSVIEALFRLQQGNDELLSDPYQIAALCLVEAGVVPGDYDADDLEALFDSAFQNPPFDPSSTAVQTCFSNAGLAVAVGG